MDYHGLKRKTLQELCKKHGIPANLKNVEMADRLSSLLLKEGKPDNALRRGRSCLKSVSEVEEVGIDEKVDTKEVKKVRFSPENQTFLFERTDPRAVRLMARKKRAFVKLGQEENPGVDSGNLVNSQSFIAVSDDESRVEEHKGRRNVRRKSVVMSEGVDLVGENDDNIGKLVVKGGNLGRNLRSRKGKSKQEATEMVSLLSPCGVDKGENVVKERNLRRNPRRSMVQGKDLSLVSGNVDDDEKLPVERGIVEQILWSRKGKEDQETAEVVSLLSPSGVDNVEKCVEGENLKRSLRSREGKANKDNVEVLSLLFPSGVDNLEKKPVERGNLKRSLRSQAGKTKDNGAGAVPLPSPCEEIKSKKGRVCKGIEEEGGGEGVDGPPNEMVDQGGNGGRVTRRQLISRVVASEDLREGDMSNCRNPKKRGWTRKSVRLEEKVTTISHKSFSDCKNSNEGVVEGFTQNSLEAILENKSRKSYRRKTFILKRQGINEKPDAVGDDHLSRGSNPASFLSENSQPELNVCQATGDSIQTEKTVEKLQEAAQRCPSSVVQMYLVHERTQSEECCDEKGTNEKISEKSEMNSLTPAEDNDLTPVIQKSDNSPSLRSMEPQYDKSTAEELEQASNDRTFGSSLQYLFSEDDILNTDESKDTKSEQDDGDEDLLDTRSIRQEVETKADTSLIEQVADDNEHQKIEEAAHLSSQSEETTQSEESCEEKGTNETTPEKAELNIHTPAKDNDSTLSVMQRCDNGPPLRSMEGIYDKSAAEQLEQVSDSRTFESSLQHMFSDDDMLDTNESKVAMSKKDDGDEDLRDTRSISQAAETKVDASLSEQVADDNEHQSMDNINANNDQMAVRLVNEGSEARECSIKMDDTKSTKEFASGGSTTECSPSVSKETVVAEHYHATRDSFPMNEKAECFSEAMPLVDFREEASNVKDLGESAKPIVQILAKDDASTPFSQITGDTAANKVQEIPFESLAVAEYTLQEQNLTAPLSAIKDSPSLRSMEAQFDSSISEQLEQTKNCLDFEFSLQHLFSEDSIFNTDESKSLESEMDDSAEDVQDRRSIRQAGKPEVDASLSEQVADINNDVQMHFTATCSFSVSQEPEVAEPYLATGESIQMVQSVEKFEEAIQLSPSISLQLNLAHETTRSVECCEEKGTDETTPEKAELNSVTPTKDNTLTPSVIQIIEIGPSLRSMEGQYDKSTVEELEKANRTFESSLKYLASEDDILNTDKSKNTESEKDDGYTRSISQAAETKVDEHQKIEEATQLFPSSSLQLNLAHETTPQKAELNSLTPAKGNDSTPSMMQKSNNGPPLRSMEEKYDKSAVEQLEQACNSRTYESSLQHMSFDDDILNTNESKGAKSKKDDDDDDDDEDLQDTRSFSQAEETKVNASLSEQVADDNEHQGLDDINANNERMAVRHVIEGSEARECSMEMADTKCMKEFASGDSTAECIPSVWKETVVAEHYHESGDSIQFEHKEENFKEATQLSPIGSVQLCVAHVMIQSEIRSEAKGTVEKISTRAEVNSQILAKNDSSLPFAMQNSDNEEEVQEIPLEVLAVVNNNIQENNVFIPSIIVRETENKTSIISIVDQNCLDASKAVSCSSASHMMAANCEALNADREHLSSSLSELKGRMKKSEIFESNEGLPKAPVSENEMGDTMPDSAALADDKLTVQLTAQEDVNRSMRECDSISGENDGGNQLNEFMSVEKVMVAYEGSDEGRVQSPSTVKESENMDTVTPLQDGAADCRSKNPISESKLSVKTSFFLQPEVSGGLSPICSSMENREVTSKETTKEDIACCKISSNVDNLALVDRPAFKQAEEANNSIKPKVQHSVSEDHLMNFEEKRCLESEKALTVQECDVVALGEDEAHSGLSQDIKLSELEFHFSANDNSVDLNSFITEVMPNDIDEMFQAAESIPYMPQEEINHMLDNLCGNYMPQASDSLKHDQCDQVKSGELMEAEAHKLNAWHSALEMHHEVTSEASLNHMDDSITGQKQAECLDRKEGNYVADMTENVFIAMEEFYCFGGIDEKAGEIEEFPEEGPEDFKDGVVMYDETATLEDRSGNKLCTEAESEIPDRRITQQNSNENLVDDQTHTVQVDACNIADYQLASKQTVDLKNLPHDTSEASDYGAYILCEKLLNSETTKQYNGDQGSSQLARRIVNEECADSRIALIPEDAAITGHDLPSLKRADNSPTSPCGQNEMDSAPQHINHGEYIGLETEELGTGINITSDVDEKDATDDNEDKQKLKRRNRSILIHGTPRKPVIPKHDMKENMAVPKRSQMVNATVMKPKRKALGNI